MVHGNCRQPGCPFAFTDAENIKDALQKVVTHYGLEHRTKFLDEFREGKRLQTYNLDRDEAIAQYAGKDWVTRLAAGGVRPRDIVYACQNVCRYAPNYREDVIREVQALSLENGQEIQDPYQNAVADDELDMVEPY